LRQQPHPNIVDIFRHGKLRDEDRVFIDMELCDLSLNIFIQKYWDAIGSWPDFEMTPAKGIIGDIANGLVFLHKQKFVHRDLKPGNGKTSSLVFKVLITVVLYSRDTNRWKIADFGFTTACSSNGLRQSDKGRGTPGYRAPELLLPGRTFNKKTDIWALGCIVFDLFTGRRAFREDHDVWEYKKSTSSLELFLDERFSGPLQETITTNVHEMLHRDQSLRPDAHQVLKRFPTRDDQVLHVQTIRDDKPNLTDNFAGNAIAEVAVIDPDAALVDANIPSSKWSVETAMVNKDNTLIATVSYHEERDIRRVQLSRSDPFQTLWEKSDADNPCVLSQFAGGGKYIGVCFGKSVDILEVETGMIFNSLSLSNLGCPTSLAIKSDGTTITVARKPSPGELQNSEVNFESFSTRSATQTTAIYQLVTTLESVALIYGVGGRHLFAIGRVQSLLKTLVGIWFDIVSGTMIKRIPFEDGEFYSVPISSVGPDVVILSSNPHRHDNPPYSRLSVAPRAGGPLVPTIGATNMIYGATQTGFVLLTVGPRVLYFTPQSGWEEIQGFWDRTNSKPICLWTWDSPQKKPQFVGRLRLVDDVPFDEIRAFAYTQDGVILVPENTSTIRAKITSAPPNAYRKAKK
jgi:serine/threonine protein kinase